MVFELLGILLAWGVAIYISIALLMAGIVGIALLRLRGLDNFVALAQMLDRGDKLRFNRQNVSIVLTGIILFWPIIPVLMRKKKPAKTLDSES